MKHILKYWYVIVGLLIILTCFLLWGKLFGFISVTLLGTVISGIEKKRAMINEIDVKRKAKNEKLKKKTYNDTNLADDPIMRNIKRKRTKNKKD